MDDKSEAICEAVLNVFKAHVTPEKDMAYNARWIEAALGACVAWLLKTRGEAWARYVFESAIDYYKDDVMKH